MSNTLYMSWSCNGSVTYIVITIKIPSLNTDESFPLISS